MNHLVKIGLMSMVVGATMLTAGNMGSYFQQGMNTEDMPQTRHMRRHNKHKVVVHVDSNNASVEKMALNNVANLQKAWGAENAEIEVVVYGPGIVMLLEQSPVYERVLEMAQSEGITFSACQNTLNKYNSTHTDEAVLIDGVEVVPSGAARIIELQEQHYGYLRP